jgi:hypothetical protein
MLMTLLARTLAAVVLTILLSSTPARAQGDPAAARELARLLATSTTFDGGVALAGASGSRSIRADVEKQLRRRLTEEEASRLQTLVTQTTKEVVSQEEWERLFAVRLSRQFSGDELRALLNFYRTPLGAKALSLSDILVKEAAATAGRLMKSHEHDFHRRFGIAFEREFAALSGEIRQSQRIPAVPGTTF